jgi:hypothetical protein
VRFKDTGDELQNDYTRIAFDLRAGVHDLPLEVFGWAGTGRNRIAAHQRRHSRMRIRTRKKATTQLRSRSNFRQESP